MYVCQCVLWMCKHVHIFIPLCNFISISIPIVKYNCCHMYASYIYVFIFNIHFNTCNNSLGRTLYVLNGILNCMFVSSTLDVLLIAVC